MTSNQRAGHRKIINISQNLGNNDFESNNNLMAPSYADGQFSQKQASLRNYQLGDLGAFNKLKSIKYDKFKDYDLVYLNCEFEKSDFTIKLMFNKRKEITDVYFIPYSPLIPIGSLN